MASRSLAWAAFLAVKDFADDVDTVRIRGLKILWNRNPGICQVRARSRIWKAASSSKVRDRYAHSRGPTPSTVDKMIV
jgi:hypothetical protein